MDSRVFFLVSLSVAGVAAACVSAPNATRSDDGGAATGDDAGPDASDASDAGVVCTGPLADAGFSSLSDMPVASLCAQSAEATLAAPRLFESQPCDGFVAVFQGLGVDCSALWVFDAATGALQATGQGCDRFPACNGAASGFTFPNECIDSAAWSHSINLCASADAASSD